MILIALDLFVAKMVYMVGVQKRNVGDVIIFMNWKGEMMDDTTIIIILIITVIAIAAACGLLNE